MIPVGEINLRHRIILGFLSRPVVVGALLGSLHLALVRYQEMLLVRISLIEGVVTRDRVSQSLITTPLVAFDLLS